jgi:hypothetical protein
MTENGDYTGRLSTEQLAAISALASGATKDQAAVAASRARRTLDRWIADEPAFQAALQAATDTAVTDAARRLAALLESALSAIQLVLEQTDTKDHDRLRAAEMVIQSTIRMREFADLEKQVAELRTAVDELTSRR